MLILGVCSTAVGNNKQRLYDRLTSQLDHQDIVLIDQGDGICNVYNSFLKIAAERQDCEAVILLHDDVFIYDSNFRAKIIAEFRDDASLGVIGVVGARRINSLAWWESPEKFGQVFETRGFINFGKSRSTVDVVDGLFMAISRTAFLQTSFDATNFTHYHGYDIDYCLQVRSKGLDCKVIPMDLLHRTKGGVGDKDAFACASNKLLEKWQPHNKLSQASPSS